MPRAARLHAPGSVIHIVSNFVDDSFRMAGPAERSAYLAHLGRGLKHHDVRIFGYSLMSSHVHLNGLEGSEPSGRLIQRVHSGYAQWLNKHQGRRGPVFAERHYSVHCDERHTARLLAYTHNNPVAAGVVDDPSLTDWTSHRAYLGLAQAPEWLDVELGLSLCGLGTSADDRLNFHRLILGQVGADNDDLEPHLSAAARRLARERAGSAVEVSTPCVGPEGGQSRLVIVPSYAPIRNRWPGSPDEVLKVVASELGVDEQQVRSSARAPELVEARRIALDVWSYGLGRPQSSMCAFLGLSRQGGSYLLLKRPQPKLVARVVDRIRAAIPVT
jgi:hypothetical protein